MQWQHRAQTLYPPNVIAVVTFVVPNLLSPLLRRRHIRCMQNCAILFIERWEWWWWWWWNTMKDGEEKKQRDRFVKRYHCDSTSDVRRSRRGLWIRTQKPHHLTPRPSAKLFIAAQDSQWNYFFFLTRGAIMSDKKVEQRSVEKQTCARRHWCQTFHFNHFSSLIRQ